jgi:hypothetical protein
MPFDPYITLFISYSDDLYPTAIREIPIGYGSRVPPFRERIVIDGIDPANIYTYTSTPTNSTHFTPLGRRGSQAPLVANPDPHTRRPNEDRRRTCGVEPTVLYLHPGNFIPLPVGPYLARALPKNTYSLEFRNHMEKLVWIVDLRDARTKIIKMLHECHAR